MIVKNEILGDSGRVLLERASWVFYALIMANAFAYVVLVSNPLIVQDSWYFLEVFIKHALDGSLHASDFFVKRAGLDHAQPLRKLILLAELRWFHLDFMLGAVIGLACAALCCILVKYVLEQGSGDDDARRLAPVGWMLITLILLSLNSTGIWTWSLVTLSYSTHVVIFGYLVVAWRAMQTGRYRWVALMAFLLAIIADDTAIIVLLALIPVLPVLWWQGVFRATLVRVFGITASIIIVVQSLMGWYSPVIGGQPSHLSLSALASIFLHGGWWKWWVLPFANSVVNYSQLRAWFGSTTTTMAVLIAVVIAAGHVWFWWKFLRTRVNGKSFFAAVLMMLCYALIAGIVIGRVTIFGSDYLNQPRYVLFYQFQLVALIMMYIGSRPHEKTALRARTDVGFVVLGCAVALLQVALTLQAWRTAPYIRAYYVGIAEQIVAMSEHPEVTPAKCRPELPPCGYSPQKRAELIGLLKRNKLNVFSWKFRQMHGLESAKHTH